MNEYPTGTVTFVFTDVVEPSGPIADRRLPFEVGKLVLHNPRLVIPRHRSTASTVRAP